MQILEAYSDERGETHFRQIEMELQQRDFTPPSPSIGVSAESRVATSLLLAAPLGWDVEYHPTPRKQFAALLSGSASVTVTDGETVEVSPEEIRRVQRSGQQRPPDDRAGR